MNPRFFSISSTVSVEAGRTTLHGVVPTRSGPWNTSAPAGCVLIEMVYVVGFAGATGATGDGAGLGAATTGALGVGGLAGGFCVNTTAAAPPARSSATAPPTSHPVRFLGTPRSGDDVVPEGCAPTAPRAAVPAVRKACDASRRPGPDGSLPHAGRQVAAGARLERERHLLHRLVALVAILGQRLHAHLLDVGRDVRARVALRRRLGRLEHVLGEHAHEGLGVERHVAGQHLVQDAAGGVDVDAMVGLVALGLLGRHVLGRAEDHPGARQPRAALVERRHLGDAEVEHLDEVGPPLARDQVDVLRLHVAVDDALIVRGAERAADLGS